MNSQIRVDYKSRYGDGSFGEKEPLIRVELEKSDDPRDTLLNEIFEEHEVFPRLGASRIKHEAGSRTFVIYKENDSSLLSNEMSRAAMTLIEYGGINMNFVTSDDRFYFELAENFKIRSKGVSRKPYYGIVGGTDPDYIRNEKYHRMTKELVEDYKEFLQSLKKSKKNLETA